MTLMKEEEEKKSFHKTPVRAQGEARKREREKKKEQTYECE